MYKILMPYIKNSYELRGSFGSYRVHWLRYILPIRVKIAGVEGEWVIKVFRETASDVCA